MRFNEPKIARIYLPEWTMKRAKDGQLIFFNKVVEVLEGANFDIEFHTDDLHEYFEAKRRRGYSIFLKQEPVNEFGITIRQNYFYPFWNIQRHARRWEWPVVYANFDPELVPRHDVLRFIQYWRKEKFGGAADRPRRDGFVYIPLQGRLVTHRTFQTCSPTDMIEAVLKHDPERKVIATLHPREKYSPIEINALKKLEENNPRLTIASGSMDRYLQGCDYVATQNSSVALMGFFFHKPAVLFAQIDFHHIASNVINIGVEEAIKSVPFLKPDYDSYLCWFFKFMSIHIEKQNAKQKIAAALKYANWPI